MRPKEAPFNMLLAMGVTAFLCIAIGVYPTALYDILPHDVDYHPYSTAHVINQLQLLLFSEINFNLNADIFHLLAKIKRMGNCKQPIWVYLCNLYNSASYFLGFFLP